MNIIIIKSMALSTMHLYLDSVACLWMLMGNEVYLQLYFKKIKLSFMHILLCRMYNYDVLLEIHLPLIYVKKILFPQKSISFE